MAAGDGLIIMTPTSIVVSGSASSASINSSGGVDFTSATSLSLNGVFRSGFNNYIIYFIGTQTPTGGGPLFKLRVAGTDTTGSDYTRQTLIAAATTVSSSRVTSSTFGLMATSASQISGSLYHVYGPALAQPTAMRLVSADAESNARVFDEADTHSLSIAYDGFSITPSSAGSGLTGNIAVFGYEE